MSYHKLGRTSSRRRAMLRDLTTNLLINERAMTTEAHAREIRSTAEKMIALGKRGDLHARCQAAAFVHNEVVNVREGNEDTVIESALQKLFNDAAPRYAERQGGYTRALKAEPGRGDGVPAVVLRLV